MEGVLHKAMQIVAHFVSHHFCNHKDKKAYHLTDAFPTNAREAEKSAINPIK
jgi:hypothetical protein